MRMLTITYRCKKKFVLIFFLLWMTLFIISLTNIEHQGKKKSRRINGMNNWLNDYYKSQTVWRNDSVLNRRHLQKVTNNTGLIEYFNIETLQPNTSILRKEIQLRNDKQSEPAWQEKLKKDPRLNATSGKYYLAAMIKVRIYSTDKSHWTVRELHQWLHYMLLAGVQHFFLCDRFNSSSEVLRPHLEPYIRAGLMTYYDNWPTSSFPNTIKAHLKCFQHVIDEFQKDVTWLVGVDMDEYPFSAFDTEDNFLMRYVQTVDASNANVQQGTKIGQIKMGNFLMLGKGDQSKNVVIERITQMTAKESNTLTKSLLLTTAVYEADVHEYALKSRFRTVSALEFQLRMLHYWGDRISTNNVSMVAMNTMADIWGPRVRRSLLAFGQEEAFSRKAGP